MAGLFTDFFNPFQKSAGTQGQAISRGSLIAFYYPASLAMKPNMIHDPYPLVVLTDIWPGAVRGVNLHYLTFPYISNVLRGNCGNSGYSYYNVKPDQYIANAFRMYKRQGMSQVKKMDCEFLLKLLGGVRSWSPDEIEALRQTVRQQLQQQLQVKASELAQQTLTQQSQLGQTQAPPPGQMSNQSMPPIDNNSGRIS